MAKVLGLSFDFHDSAAALISDNLIVAAAAEERFSRKKHSSDFPKLAIEYCLEKSICRSVSDLDAVVFYEKPTLKLQRILDEMIASWPFSAVTFSKLFPTYISRKLDVRGQIERQLQAFDGPIMFIDHHLSHAAAAFYPSPFTDAAILIMDGVGEQETITLAIGEESKIHVLKTQKFPHSIGLLYSALTSYLGFEVNEGEWKVMGLGAYGHPKYVSQIESLFEQYPDGSFSLHQDFFAFGPMNYSSHPKNGKSSWVFREDFQVAHLNNAMLTLLAQFNL